MGEIISNIERRCIITGEEIHECMGYSLARDVLAHMEGKRNSVREISGRGMLIVERLSAEAGMEPYDYLEHVGIIEKYDKKACGGI